MRVVVLPWHAVAELHVATEMLRDPSDARLSPGVCGYRRGAEPGSSYAREFKRFCEITRGEGEHAGAVVYADIRGFFGSVTWPNIVKAARDTAGDAAAEAVAEWVDRAIKEDLRHPPAGYADARLLSNLVLVSVDESLSVPFARWVDDYRLFVDDAALADECLSTLRAALAIRGFALAPGKQRIHVYSPRATPDELASVYHPEHETALQARSALRTIWADAVLDPIRNRRQLRFTLPRLAAEGDGVAVPFALDGLVRLPWEAPRLVAYLAEFGSDVFVQHRVAETLCEAVLEADLWRVARILPLACRLPAASVQPKAIPVILKSLSQLRESPVWGLALRFLALHGVGDAGEEAAIDNAPDPRAALASRADLGLSLDIPAASHAEATAVWLSVHTVAPPPRIDGVL